MRAAKSALERPPSVANATIGCNLEWKFGNRSRKFVLLLPNRADDFISVGDRLLIPPRYPGGSSDATETPNVLLPPSETGSGDLGRFSRDPSARPFRIGRPLVEQPVAGRSVGHSALASGVKSIRRAQSKLGVSTDDHYVGIA